MLATFNLKREQNAQLFAVESEVIHCEFHFHSHVELLIVLEEQMEVTINDRQKLLRAGEIAVALSYDAHSFRTPTKARAISIVIPTELCPEFLAAVADRKTSTPFLENRELFETACSCFRGIKEANNEISKKGQLYVLLGAVLTHMELEQKQTPSDTRPLTSLLIYLNTHFREDISLASMAAEMGYNPSYLSRCFHASLHISIPAYLTMLRLRQAVLLMKDPEKSVTDCAFESGFRSLRSFYRAFREEFHCSPKEYRHASA